MSNLFISKVLCFAVFLTIFLSSAQKVKATSVPPPEPVGGNYLIGSYFMPKTIRMNWWWLMIDKYNRSVTAQGTPEKKRLPLLGFYDLSNPEVFDWQIKWAVEHGISYWIFDEYWTVGSNVPKFKYLMDSFLNSTYKNYMKFAVMYTNHGPTLGDNPTTAERNLLAITDYWIANYFSRSNYLKIDNQPLVVVWNPYMLAKDFGDDWNKLKNVVQKMNNKIINSGTGSGLYLAFVNTPGAGALEILANTGFKAIIPYGCGELNSSYPIPYGQLVTDCQEKGWKRILEAIKASGKNIKFVPGFLNNIDDSPRGPDGFASPGTINPNLNDFGQMLTNLKNLVNNSNYSSYFINFQGKKMIGSKNWCEWEEDTELEPSLNQMSVSNNFAILDAVREILTFNPLPHQDAFPQDISPYQVESTNRTSWQFDAKEELKDWINRGEAWEPVLDNGKITIVIPERLDFEGATKLKAADYERINLSAKLSCNNAPCGTSPKISAKIYWFSSLHQWWEPGEASFNLVNDNNFHLYKIETVGQNRWEGEIEALRIELIPPVKPATLTIDFIQVEKGVKLATGWNQIVWPNITGKKASDIPPECPIAVAKENLWFTPYVKNFGGMNFNFEKDKTYYLKCNQEVTWSL